MQALFIHIYKTMTLSHKFETQEQKDELFHAFIFLNSCQCCKKYWDDESFGVERVNALRYLQSEAYKTDWVKAMAAIELYSPRLVEVARVNVAYFLTHYPQDAEYLKFPQVFAVCSMLDKMRKNPDAEKSNPVLSKPPKQKKKK